MKQLKPYPKYKPSGVEWLGDVPEHWETQKLSRWFGSYGSGTTPSSESDYSDTGIPWVTTGELRENTIRETDKRVTQKAILFYSALKIHPDSSLVIAMYGATVGRIGRLGVPATLNQACFAIHPNEGISLDMLTYWFQGFRDELITLATGAGQPNISADKIKLLRVSSPTNPIEQSAIAAFLDHRTGHIDALMEKKTRFIELLKEKRQALITDAVTGKFDVSTGKPYPAYKSSGVEWLGDVPEGWEVCRVGALYREVSDKGDNELPILTISIHHGASNNELSEDERDRKVVRIDDKSKYKRVQPGDLVYNMMRAWQGGFGAILVKGLVSPAYVVARSKIELSSEYIELQFRTPQAIEAMRRYSHGITDFRLRLYWEKFKTMFVTLPTFSGQAQIMDFIFSETGRIDSLWEKTEKSIELLKEKRQALITATVTGKIDVRNS